jgi:DNA-binding transcriptional ArsR family regulator
MSPDVFDALANPIRRELLAELRGGPKPVNALAARFDRGRPAISEHLAVLRAAGLVRHESRGRERWYHLDARPLRDVERWIEAYRQFWDERLTGLSDLLDEENP